MKEQNREKRQEELLLTNDLKQRQETEQLLREYKNFKGKLEAGFQRGRDEGLKAGLAEGRIEGIAEGRAEGRYQMLSTQIKRKIAKGKSIAQIADELEEPEETILPLYNQLVTMGD